MPAALHKLGNVVPQAWPSLRSAEAALEFQQQVLRSRIEARIRELVMYARLRLQGLPGLEFLTTARPGAWGGILTFRVAGHDATSLAATMIVSHRVYVRDLRWPDAAGSLRASLQIFNSHDDIDRLVQSLQQALR